MPPYGAPMPASPPLCDAAGRRALGCAQVVLGSSAAAMPAAGTTLLALACPLLAAAAHPAQARPHPTTASTVPSPRAKQGHPFPRLANCWGAGEVQVSAEQWAYQGFMNVTNETWADYDLQYINPSSDWQADKIPDWAETIRAIKRTNPSAIVVGTFHTTEVWYKDMIRPGSGQDYLPLDCIIRNADGTPCDCESTPPPPAHQASSATTAYHYRLAQQWQQRGGAAARLGGAGGRGGAARVRSAVHWGRGGDSDARVLWWAAAAAATTGAATCQWQRQWRRPRPSQARERGVAEGVGAGVGGHAG
jgi:hypothetical protein